MIKDPAKIEEVSEKIKNKVWLKEPNRVEFEYKGMPCLINRNSHTLFLCGYVGVTPEHPYHKKNYNDIDDIEVHGGLTYSKECSGAICHKSKTGEEENVWWFGFDCGHLYDYMPASEKWKFDDDWIISHEEYRDIEYVKGEIERLADQLLAVNTNTKGENK